MKKILILHGYSAENIGDGLLVYEAIEFIREAHPKSDITVLSSYPDSFKSIENVKYIRSKPYIFGYKAEYLKYLFNLGSYDSIVGVGGGYLRTGGFKESIGTLLTHAPQLFAASFFGKKVVYLPQSIGPLGIFLKIFYKFLLSKLKTVYIRDDKSVFELNLKNVKRVPDMAILKIANSYRSNNFNNSVDLYKNIPVFSVRKVKGNIPDLFFKLVNFYDHYDSYIQSSVGGNNDLEVSSLLNPEYCLSKDELMNANNVRVVIAVRLHAALMAIERGHFVIHLSYERKGFSAFKDLGLEDYVFNVNNFNVDIVKQRIDNLLKQEESRKEYKNKISEKLPSLIGYRDEIIQDLTEI